MTNTTILNAKRYGKLAAKHGIRHFVHDPAAMKLLNGVKVGGGGREIIEAWNNANLDEVLKD